MLEKLQSWYQSQCDGDWEHSYGVKIDTLDNPGWLVKVDLVDTNLDGRNFSEITEGVGEDAHPQERDWPHCYVKDQQFIGAGGPTKLEQIINIFVDWAC